MKAEEFFGSKDDVPDASLPSLIFYVAAVYEHFFMNDACVNARTLASDAFLLQF